MMTKSTSTDAPTHVLRGILVPIDWDGDQVRTLALETDGEGEYLVEVPMRQSFTRDIGEYETEWQTCEDCNGEKQIEEEIEAKE